MTDRKLLRALLVTLGLIVLCLPAIHPFLQGQMPLADDARLHLYRGVALEHALSSGAGLWPRYVPGLVAGYGASLFNYFPPLSYYPVAFFHWLGLSFVDAWLATVIAFTLVAAVGAYRLGAFWGSTAAGFLTAAAYIYAPYFLFDSVARGTSTEVAALALLPWAMWGFSRAARDGGRIDLALAVVSFAVFIPMHTLITLHGTALLAAYCLFLALINPRPVRTFLRLLTAGVIGLLITTFFWLPAIAETGDIRIQQVTEALDTLDVTRTLRDPAALLELPHTADPTQLRAVRPIVLGWPQVILAGLGLLFIWRTHERRLRWIMLFCLATTAAIFVMNLEFAAPIWRRVPFINLTQFAWRTLGLASLTLALAAGLGGAYIVRRIGPESAQKALYAIFVAIVAVYAFPWLYTPYIDIQAESIVDAQDYERRTRELTLASYSEYLPIWNADTPDMEALRERFVAADGAPIPRLSQPPAGVNLVDADWGAISTRLQLDLDEPARLVLDWLYMPGWVARIADAERAALPLTVRPTEGVGLVSVELPAGTYTLSIALEPTQLQSIAWIASAAGLMAFALLVLLGPRVRDRARLEPVAVERWALLVIAVGVGLMAFKVLVIDPGNTLIKRERFADGVEAGVQTALNADFGGEITLLGVMEPESAQNGSEALLRLFWAAQDARPERDYSTSIHLRDSAGLLVAEGGSFYPGDLATSNWLPGYYVEEHGLIAVPVDTPPGTYTLDLGVYDPESGEQLDVLNDAGDPLGVRVRLGTLTVSRAPQREREIKVSAPVGLYGGQPVPGLPDRAQAGDEIAFTWRWQAAEVDADYQARLVWQNGRTTAAISPALDLVPGFPVTEWLPGEVWAGLQEVLVPVELTAGDYLVAVQLIDADGQIVNGIEAVGRMTVTVPERIMSLSEDRQILDEEWQNGLRLRGYETGVTGVTLYWQTRTPLNTSLRLFVHLLGEDGRIAEVQDSIPVDWTRPTTGWLPGEVILTMHDFGLDLSGRTLRIGWYAPETENRILLENGEDSYLLTLP